MLDALFPLTCPGCGGRGKPVCAACAAALVPPPPAFPPPGIDGWAAPFAYEGVARELVARVKYRNVRAAVPWLADRMCEAIPPGVRESLHVVTWAPTTPVRRRTRGFDPGEVLARAAARRLGLACRPLLRRLPGPPQTGLPAGSRRHGPRLEAIGAVPPNVLVVDDVATTGATLAAAAGALRHAGAQGLFALTAARTPAPGPRRPGSPDAPTRDARGTGRR